MKTTFGAIAVRVPQLPCLKGKGVRPLVLLAALLLTIGGCDDPGTASTGASGKANGAEGNPGSTLSGTLTLTGSSTVAPLAAEIGRRFEQLHPDVRVDVQSGGSSRGIRDAHSGAADVGMSSRALKPDERDGVRTFIIAWDGVAFVVHRDNPVAELTKQQLIDIYTGKVDNWKAVGGVDAPIIVSNRAEGRSELDLMTSHLGVDPTSIKADMIDGETQQTIKTVTTNANAIMYTSVGAAQHAAESGAPLKLLPLNGVPASTKTVQTGDFPLARPLVLIRKADTPSVLADAFIDYARSPAVDDLAEGLGYVSPARDSE